MSENQPIIWPSGLTDDLREILGMMCFQLGPIAHVYQNAGEFVGADGAKLRKRAEDEQAFMLHKLIAVWIEHGANWREVAAAEIERAMQLATRRAMQLATRVGAS